MRIAAADAAGVALLFAIVPFIASGCRSAPSYRPGLGEIMTLTQMRHVKLRLAGEAGNWPLADYELDELEEGLADAAHFHPTHKGSPRPLTELIPEFTAPPLRALRMAVSRRNASSFVSAYDSLTAACNGCHQATGFSFNVVTRPATNPYPSQQFRPGRDRPPVSCCDEAGPRQGDPQRSGGG